MEPGPILVPVDFSDSAESALAWAAEYHLCVARPLIVLHVAHDPEDEPGFYRGEPGDKRLRTLEDRARGMFEKYLLEASARLPALARAAPRGEVVVGLPAQRILEVAEREGVAHIVMGSLGRTGLAHLLLGSVAQKIVQLAPMPVTIVKGAPVEARD